MSERRPFTTDGCSGGLSRAWRAVRGGPPPWEGCCVEHDRPYWRGGSALERRAADRRMRRCIARHSPAWALACYVAVRLGGHPWLPLPWRWDYGRPWPGRYE